MKKFLTVLLVIAVMFTFSFGSAFAAVELKNVVTERTDAIAKITTAYETAVGTLDRALAEVKAGAKNPENASAADWNTACEDAYAVALSALDVQLAKAYQEFGTAEQEAMDSETGLLGYEFKTVNATEKEVGYAYIADAIAEINLDTLGVDVWANGAFVNINAGEAMYEALLASTKAMIANYDLDQFVKDDKITVDGVTKSSYEWAVAAQTEALAKLNAFKGWGKTVVIDKETVICNVTAVRNVYNVAYAGTAGETESGSFYDAIASLNTVKAATTDNAKIEYAKAQMVANVKSAIEAARAKALDPWNKVVFAQSIAAKPNQTKIDEANEKIAEINKAYDAYQEVMAYRLANATYKVTEHDTVETIEYVVATYDNAAYRGIAGAYDRVAEYRSNVLQADRLCGTITVADLAIDEEQALDIVKKIAELEEQAELLKATVAVDGAYALAVDEALEDAIESVYMTGNGSLSVAMSDTVVHYNAHKLLGTKACTGAVVTDKVTIDGTKYNNVSQWTTDGYSPKNTKAVKAIIKEAKAAIKAAETVDAANEAFLAAYAEYDAVLTTAEQAALFYYNGPLYKQDAAVFAELNAYIEYKVALMEDAPDGKDTANELKDYFADNLLTEVNNAEDLAAAVAEAKATVDSLKTKAELKAEGQELTKTANAVKRAVTLEQKDEVLALYDALEDYKDYCDMVGYEGYSVAASKALVETDIDRLEDLELAALNAAKKALGSVDKLTLEDAAEVEAFVAAQDAYNELYGVKGDYKAGVDYTAATAYEDEIFDLGVEAAEKLIMTLPVNPTVAQVLKAQEAVDALGFEGLCAISPSLLTKLDKFTQDANEVVIANVEALKITAKSSAKKGSITVKWTVKGDATGVEAYEIWKSTKHSSGYKKAFTTEKMSYKNTKGLKKGTRYYYKVRAIAYVEGEKIKSDWSNKARRIAK